MDYDYIIDANGGGDFRTIQEAIDAAEKEGRFLVKSGVYVENCTFAPAKSGDEISIEGCEFEGCTFESD